MECLRTIGMGGIGKHRTKASTSGAGGGNKQARLSSMFPFPLLLDPLFLFPAHSQILQLQISIRFTAKGLLDKNFGSEIFIDL